MCRPSLKKFCDVWIKTESSDFHCRPFWIQFCSIKTNGSSMGQGQSLNMFVVWHCRDGRQRVSYCSILVVSLQFRALIALVVNSREWNQSSGQVGKAHDAGFSSNSNKQKALPYVDLNQDYGTIYGVSSILNHDLFIHYYCMWLTFHRPLLIFSKMGWMHLISAVNPRWKFGTLNFSNFQLLFASSPIRMVWNYFLVNF